MGLEMKPTTYNIGVLETQPLDGDEEALEEAILSMDLFLLLDLYLGIFFFF